MHAAYEEEDKRVLQHDSKEELVCHCRLARAEEARMVAVTEEASRARVKPANRVQTRNLPSRP